MPAGSSPSLGSDADGNMVQSHKCSPFRSRIASDARSLPHRPLRMRAGSVALGGLVVLRQVFAERERRLSVSFQCIQVRAGSLKQLFHRRSPLFLFSSLWSRSEETESSPHAKGYILVALVIDAHERQLG